MPRTWMSHVTHLNGSCNAYEWVMSRIQMSRVAYTNESYHWQDLAELRVAEQVGHVTRRLKSCNVHEWVISLIYDLVMSHMWMSHVTRVNEPCYWWDVAELRVAERVGHVTRMNESCHVHRWDMSRTWMRHVTYMVMSIIWMTLFSRDMSHSYVTWWHVTYVTRRDSSSCHVRDMSHMDMVMSIIWMTLFTRDMSHSYVTWLIHVKHDPLIYDRTYSFMRHDSFIRDMTDPYVTWLIHM